MRAAAITIRDVLDAAEAQGWRARQTRSRNWMLFAPAGRQVPGLESVTIGHGDTESGWRNDISRLERAGLVLRDRPTRAQTNPHESQPSPEPSMPDRPILSVRAPNAIQPRPASPLTQARERLTALGDHVVNELSAIGELLDQHDQATQKLVQLRELLKEAL